MLKHNLRTGGVAWPVVLLAAVCLASPPHADAEPLVPNDTFYAAREWYGPLMHMPEAWGISTGSPAVTIAVLDTGVISTTEDLAGRILPPLSATGIDPFTDAWMLDPASPGRRHGTWVASAAAMEVNNGIGGAGVGNFSILPITITGTSLVTSSLVAAAGIQMAADAGARVINLSYMLNDYSVIEDAAAYARSKGALVFAGAGNTDGLRNVADLPNAIIVSGTNAQDGRWTDQAHHIGSSYGAFVDLSAPAEDVLVADPTLPRGYGIDSGTSFATPLAAGAAALAWSINPRLTPDEVQDILFRTAADLGAPGRDEVFGWGRVDYGAVAAAAAASVPEPCTAAELAAVAMILGLAKVWSRWKCDKVTR